MSTNLNFAMIKRTFELRTYESRGSVDSAQDLRTGLEVAGSIPGLAFFFFRILMTVIATGLIHLLWGNYCSRDGNIGKQPVV